jgi:hypothetical protein
VKVRNVSHPRGEELGFARFSDGGATMIRHAFSREVDAVEEIGCNEQKRKRGNNWMLQRGMNAGYERHCGEVKECMSGECGEGVGRMNVS